MIKIKLEIRSHDGPGRFGKLEKEESPLIINKKKYKIAPDEGSSYNIQKEIAERCVIETIKKSKLAIESDEDYKIAIIQGSKYLDLRIKCIKELEKLGYIGFVIANGDELILNPKNLVEIIINLRENMNPNSFLIFPFAEPSFIPLLCYLGIDGFFDDCGDYYSYLNVLLTPTKAYDLDNYKIYENKTREDISKFNKKIINFVLKEVRVHMKNKTLRNLVEERSVTSPQNISALKIIDKNYKEYLLKYSQLY
ncbi:MAG: archaeosine tRNA-ribosyltransferase [Methanobacteriaceae archaeon]|nr:archaeosine tRNA-ribosyltransferase [Methanobacteriaceae archaeon]